ncbi:hypothetical protein V757_11135 [Pelistega indica]|uniref:Lipoprotein n=1 Tax=Pelistega indica TaxID=1414851 RepID=V8FTT1_9BURK|nr:hypothetical protein [Pelistega indica]ETD67535.1 hypothetical protein V757_11135 [Pelistega indica]
MKKVLLAAAVAVTLAACSTTKNPEGYVARLQCASGHDALYIYKINEHKLSQAQKAKLAPAVQAVQDDCRSKQRFVILNALKAYTWEGGEPRDLEGAEGDAAE